VPRRPIFDDPELGPLTDDQLTRDVRVFQRAKGHRFSSDDVVTAYLAYRAAPAARRVLDLGCGLGSVLLHLAWKLPDAELVGIEAQAESFQLLERNVARSGFASRIRIEHGDLREPAWPERLGTRFELISGTPPYFPPDAALDAQDRQRALARVEYRGGIEAYIGAGAKLLDPAGALVVCGDARALQRTTLAAQAAGLSIQSRCDVVARAGREPLFSVWTLRFDTGSFHLETLTLRDAAGAPTSDALLLREFSGIARMSS
jgi:tRNA1Val (adenine37-N6)-methyltransferase